MTVEEFKYVDPGVQFISVLYEGSTVKAVNISTIDCNNQNIAKVLSELINLLITINGIEYTFTVINSENFVNYYHFTIEEFTIAGIASIVEGDCIRVVTSPSFEGTGFEKSDYQALKNNANFARTTSLIFDVDRQKMSIKADNIELINNNSATLANYQELNYTSIGLTNSRYVGAKTNRLTYGTVAGISLGTFEGVVYNKNVDNERICSQSASTLNENKILLGLNDTFNVGSSTPNGLPTYSKGTNPILFNGYISGSAAAPAELDRTTTTIDVDWRVADIPKLQPNGLYHFMTQDSEEFFILRSYTLLSGPKTVDLSTLNTYRFVVDRGASGTATSHTATSYTSNRITIKKVESSQIFQFEGSKVTTLSNRKVYLPLTDIVVETGINGMVYSGSLACT